MSFGNAAGKPTTTARPDRRLLVVDDEAKLVDFVCRALSAEGFAVDGATDGARALALIQSGTTSWSCWTC